MILLFKKVTLNLPVKSYRSLLLKQSDVSVRFCEPLDKTQLPGLADCAPQK